MKHHVLTLGVLTCIQTISFVYYIMLHHRNEPNEEDHKNDLDLEELNRDDSDTNKEPKVENEYDIEQLYLKKAELDKLKNLVEKLEVGLESVRDNLENLNNIEFIRKY